MESKTGANNDLGDIMDLARLHDYVSREFGRLERSPGETDCSGIEDWDPMADQAALEESLVEEYRRRFG